MPVSLDDAFQFLYGEGERVPGWEGDHDELVRLAERSFPGKPYCLVRRWAVVDVTGAEDELAVLSSEGLLTKVLFAHEVVMDSRNRFPAGYWVRSNFGVSYEHGCLFETRSTTYLLLGEGNRKQADLDTVFSLRP